MKKFEYYVEEKLTYVKKIEIETELSEDAFLALTENAERNAMSAEEVAILLDSYPKVNVTKFPDKDYSSPREAEVEYYDHK